jgi:tetratricopeptide (TPR) repeat protein
VKKYKEEEIYLLQEDIANSVADTLKLNLKIGKAKPSKLFGGFGGTDNYEAWKYYLMARIQLYDLKDQAKESIDRAISLDPNYPHAWALKGLVHFMVASFFSNADEMPLEKTSALNAALHAIELEPSLGKAYLTLGTVHMMKGNFIEAERAYQKGINLTNESIDYFDYGLTLHYNVVGRLKKCTEFLDEARKNDPFKQSLYSTNILSLGFMGDIEGAEKEYQLGKDIFGNEWNIGHEVITLLRFGSGNILSTDEIVYSSKIYDSVKRYLDSPEKGLAELREFCSEKNKLTEKEITDISVWAAYFGDPEFAMDALETGVETNSMGLFKIWLPVMQEVRKLPRFKKLVRDSGLLEYWNEFEWPDRYCRPVGNYDFECD